MLSYRFQNNNIFASKSASQPRGDGNKGDRFPLYITNIPADIDEDQLKEIFSQAGDVIQSKCLPPREGRNSKVG
ncbi:28 kDa ribonucleo, chloroplastic, partial [Paramuricea clavata]